MCASARLILEHSHAPQRSPIPICSHPAPPQPLTATNALPVSGDWPVLDASHPRTHTLCVLCLLLSLSVVLSGPVSVAARARAALLFAAEPWSHVWGGHVVLLCSALTGSWAVSPSARVCEGNAVLETPRILPCLVLTPSHEVEAHGGRKRSVSPRLGRAVCRPREKPGAGSGAWPGCPAPTPRLRGPEGSNHT